jgi:hypothetical protein
MLAPEERKRVFLEIVCLYVLTLIGIKGVVVGQTAFGLPADVLVMVPILFVYVPYFFLRARGLHPPDFGLVIEQVRPAMALNLKLSLAIFPLFIVGNHYFQQWVFHRTPLSVLPNHFLTEVVA